MRLLFAISAGSLCAVLLAVFAAARRVRRRRALAAKAPQPRFTLHAREFFEAGEFRTPRPLRMEQEIFRQKPRRPLSQIAFPPKLAAEPVPAQDQGAPSAERPRAQEPTPIRPPAGFATLFGETGRVHQPGYPLEAFHHPLRGTGPEGPVPFRRPDR